MVLADLTDPEAVRNLMPAAAAFGPLTLLVNNASQFDEDEIGTLDRARFEAHVRGQSDGADISGAGLRRAGAAQAPTPRSSTSSISACSSRRRAFSPTP